MRARTPKGGKKGRQAGDCAALWDTRSGLSREQRGIVAGASPRHCARVTSSTSNATNCPVYALGGSPQRASFFVVLHLLLRFRGDVYGPARLLAEQLPLDRLPKQLDVDRLDHPSVGASPLALSQPHVSSIRGQDEDRRCRVLTRLSQLPNQVQTVHYWHMNVDQNQIDCSRASTPNSLLPILRLEDSRAFGFKSDS